jgi:hypothetical protein
MEKQVMDPKTALLQDKSSPHTRPKAKALTTKIGKAGRKRITDCPIIKVAEIRGAQMP